MANIDIAIEYVKNNIKYGSEIKYIEIEDIFERYKLNKSKQDEVYNELMTLKIIDKKGFHSNYIFSEEKEYKTDKNLDNTIEYINNNIKYGSEIKSNEIEDIFIKYKLNWSKIKFIMS